MSSPTPLLDVHDLRTHFVLDHGVARAVDGISFTLNAGECLALVGESGCGKSVTSLSIMRLLNSPPARNAGGEILFEGQNLLKLTEQEMTLRRGKDLAMIFQEPQSALNPVFPVGEQVAEAYRIHNPKCSTKEALERAIEALRIVGIPDPGTRSNDHPHQLSGGMKQRVCIAMGLICSPKLLIADEPTTALDVTIQAQILELLRSLQKERGLALLLITHDLGVVAEMAERTCVMYAGKIVETAPTRELFAKPLHPYTQGLLRARPRPGSNQDIKVGPRSRLAEIPGMVPTATKFGDDCRFRARCPLAVDACSKEPPLETHGEASHRSACWRAGEDAAAAWEQIAAIRVPTSTTAMASKENSKPLVEVKELRKHFELSSGWFGKSKQSVKAVNDISFSIGVGETLGLVGESGCGKTTAGRTLLQLIPPSGGQVHYQGEQVTGLSEQQLRPYRREMQIIFQDPFSSLNPRLTVEQIIAEGLNIHASLVPPTEIRPRVLSLLEKVGLPADALRRYPHEFSGGQRQRIGIARALAVNPRFIVCDEAVSALDVSVQAQIINLLMDLQSAEGLSYLFIAHDLSVVEHISHRVAVMYLGHLVEIAPTRELFSNPKHPYTRALLSAVPKRSPAELKERQILKGEPPSPIHPPPGCPFAPRCPLVQPSCTTQLPALTSIQNDTHWVRCPIAQ